MTTDSPIDPARSLAIDEVSLPGGLQLRGLGDADIGPLAAAMTAMEPWLGLGHDAAALTRYWRRPDATAVRLGLYANEQIRGAVCVRPRWLCGAYLELLCVLPSAQGRGHGRRLLHWLLGAAATLGPNLWTTVSASNHRARVFYRASGFVDAALIPSLLAPGKDELLLRRTLHSEPTDSATPGP